MRRRVATSIRRHEARDWRRYTVDNDGAHAYLNATMEQASARILNARGPPCPLFYGPEGLERVRGSN